MKILMVRKQSVFRFSLVLICFLCVVCGLQAQVQTLKNESNRTFNKDANDTFPRLWKTGGLYNLNFTQAALSNWSAGGDKSALSLNTLLSLYAFYMKGKHSWDNTLDMAFGMVNTTSLGTRKSDDRIDLVSKYGYNVGDHWFLSALFNFRSQFAKGYDYPSNGSKVLTSNWLSPAYILLSAGMDYKPNDHFSLFLSPATARWIIVQNDSLSHIGAFGVDSNKHVKFQFGAFASLNYVYNFSKTAAWKTKLDLFSDYLKNPQNIVIFWTNILSAQVTRLVSMSLSVDMIYDDKIKSVKSDGTFDGPKPQIKEVLGIGLAYKFNNIPKKAPVKPAS